MFIFLFQNSLPKGQQEITLSLRDSCKPLNFKLIPGQKFCVKCHVALYKVLKDNKLDFNEADFVSSPSVQSSTSDKALDPSPPIVPKNDSSSFELSATPSSLEHMNKFVEKHGYKTIDFTKLNQTTYVFEKLTIVLKCFQKLSGTSHSPDDDIGLWEEQSKLFREMIHQMKSFIETSTNNSAKVLALSTIPKSWPTAQVMEFLAVSKRLVAKVKSLVNEKG